MPPAAARAAAVAAIARLAFAGIIGASHGWVGAKTRRRLMQNALGCRWPRYVKAFGSGDARAAGAIVVDDDRRSPSAHGRVRVADGAPISSENTLRHAPRSSARHAEPIGGEEM